VEAQQQMVIHLVVVDILLVVVDIHLEEAVTHLELQEDDINFSN
jgi:hypothetical protein